jgi:hypothetical protein
MLGDVHDAPLDERGAQRDGDARRLGRIVQREARRPVVLDAFGEVDRLAQERIGEALVEVGVVSVRMPCASAISTRLSRPSRPTTRRPLVPMTSVAVSWPCAIVRDA